jgi:hypothetical protein
MWLSAEAYRQRNVGMPDRVNPGGPASYEHTLMRVRTMGAKALFGRIAAIERTNVGRCS